MDSRLRGCPSPVVTELRHRSVGGDFLKPGERKLQPSPLPGLSTESKSEMDTRHTQKPASLLMELLPATSKRQGQGHGRGSKVRGMPLFLTWPEKGSWAAVEHMGV